nr:unnamed protein product [Callosobruchus analis]
MDSLLESPAQQDLQVQAYADDGVIVVSGRFLSTNQDPLVHECVERLEELATLKEVTLMWVPAHTEVSGNEEADRLARLGTREQFVGPELAVALGRQQVTSALKRWVNHPTSWPLLRSREGSAGRARPVVVVVVVVVVEGQQIPLVFPINAGVPQGSVLSPTLFLLYINELLEITSNPVYSFADDSTLVSCMEPGKSLPSQQTARLRQHHASQINAGIRKVVEWGLVNKVQFNVQKTQATTLTRKSLVGLPTVEMEGRPIVESPSVKLLEINISNNMSWHDHVFSIAKTESQKLEVLFRCRKLYIPEQLLLLYKAQIRPSLEYCSHVWSCAPKHSLKLLDSIQSRAVRLIDTPNLTRDLDSLEHRRRVAALSLFYRFYQGTCSTQLSQIIIPKAVRKKNTREALCAHPYQVEVATPRTSFLQHSFFWRTSTLWNELPGNLFPDGYNLQRFKTKVHRHLFSRSASAAP